MPVVHVRRQPIKKRFHIIFRTTFIYCLRKSAGEKTSVRIVRHERQYRFLVAISMQTLRAVEVSAQERRALCNHLTVLTGCLKPEHG